MKKDPQVFPREKGQLSPDTEDSQQEPDLSFLLLSDIFLGIPIGQIHLEVKWQGLWLIDQPPKVKRE